MKRPIDSKNKSDDVPLTHLRAEGYENLKNPLIPASEIIKLSCQAFWDINMENLDYENNAYYIIRKVFDYGTWEDMLEVVTYYGEQKVIDALVSAPYLKELTIVFTSKLFHIPLESYKCYYVRQVHSI